MLKITGRVYVQETGKGLPGLSVKAVDRDLQLDDAVKEAVTDKEGRFEITYDKRESARLFEKAPDLYIVVRDARSRRIIYSSEDSLRSNAGTEENIDVPVPQSALDAAAGAPTGSKRGKVKIRLKSPAGQTLPEEVKLFFTEHRGENRRQHVVTARTEKELSLDLPPGEYTMQIAARGFETVRGLVEVNPRKGFTVDAALKPRTRKVRTFEERLAKYGIDASKTEIGELNVPANTTLALNHQNDREKRGFKMLQADTITKVKEWIGSDDARFGHDRAVYGPLPDPKHLRRLDDDNIDLRELDSDEVRAVTALAREYIEGNSKAVARYEPVLSKAIKVGLHDAIAKFPLYFYRVVTIGPGATLEVGNGSAIFSCDELRIHKTGKLKPVKSVTIEVGTYTEFQ